MEPVEFVAVKEEDDIDDLRIENNCLPFDLFEMEEKKQELTDALKYCIDLLKDAQIILDLQNSNGTISRRSQLMGKEIRRRIVDMLYSMKFMDEEMECQEDPMSFSLENSCDSNGKELINDNIKFVEKDASILNQSIECIDEDKSNVLYNYENSVNSGSITTVTSNKAASNNANETVQTSSEAYIQAIKEPTCPTNNKHKAKSNESQHTNKSHKRNKSPSTDHRDGLMKKLQTENDKLKEKILKLDAELKKRSEKVEKLTQRNNELQDIIINKFRKMDLMFDWQQRIQNPSKVEEYPVGYRKRSDNTIYLSNGEWLNCTAYDTIVYVSKKSPGLFVKNIAVAIFGIDTLKNSSVTGTVSNRFKNQIGAKPALNGTKLMAIRGIFEHWLKFNKFDKIARDFYLSRTRYFVAHKISELNRREKSNSYNRACNSHLSHTIHNAKEDFDASSVVHDDQPLRKKTKTSNNEQNVKSPAENEQTVDSLDEDE